MMKRCRVTGVIKSADGAAARRKIRFVPDSSGWFGTEYVTSDPVEVRTEEDGTFAVLLVPSSVVGRYKVIIGDSVIYIVVPEEPQAKLDSLLTGGA
jgi:hypothetical protein